MNSIHDVLETCLQEVENGAQVETVLERYPEFAEALRPILQAYFGARTMAVSGPSVEVLRRNRAKLLQHSAMLREREHRSFLWLPAIRKWAMALALLVLFLFSGTSLVRASSAALPGDSLYTVKRSWEEFTLAFTFDSDEREILEVEHENERLEELHELFTNDRTAQVDFAGIISGENENGWWVEDIMVIVTDQTVLPVQPLQVGAAVRVYGITGGNGVILAERIESLPAGAPLPEVEDDDQPEIEVEGPQATAQPDNSGSGLGSGSEEEDTPTPSTESTPMIESLTGNLMSMNQELWRIGSTGVDVSDAEIKGIPLIGALVRADGYFGEDGVFVALKITIGNTSSTSGNGNDNEDDNSNEDNDISDTKDNINQDDSNDNTNDDPDDDDNSNEDLNGSGRGGNDNNENGGNSNND
jgi:hypothetical protein